MPGIAEGRRQKSIADDPLKDFLTITETARRLGISEATIFHHIKLGRFHPVKKLRPNRKGRNQKILLFNPTEVDAEIERLEQKRSAHLANRMLNRDIEEPPAKQPPVPRSKTKTRQEKPETAPPEVVEIAPDSPVAIADQPKEKKSIQPSRDGKLCAQAVKLFREGKTQLDVVVEMEVNFEIARYYEECYHYAQPGWFLPKKDFAHLRQLLGWSETPPTPEGFMKAVRQFIDKEVHRIVNERSIQGDDLTEEERRQLAELDDKPEEEPEEPSDKNDKAA